MHANTSTRAEPLPDRNHGGAVQEEAQRLGIPVESILDFSSNINPYGPPPGLARALSQINLHQYPEPHAESARACIARLLGYRTDEVVIGNGAADILWSLAQAFLRPGDPIVVCEPTFSEFRIAATALRARVTAFASEENSFFEWDIDCLRQCLIRNQATMAYLCAPNNPTGTLVSADALARLAEQCPETLLIIDQAFLTLSDHHEDLNRRFPENTILVRSLTKDLAIPAIRVGYALASAPIIDRIENTRPPWNTNGMAQRAASLFESFQPFLADSRSKLAQDRAFLSGAMGDLGLSPTASCTNFLLFSVKEKASQIGARLLGNHRIMVRDCASFGLPNHLRVCVRPRADADRLISALRTEAVK